MFRCVQTSVGTWPFRTWDSCTFFHALMFGLNAAPFIFTQVLAWPLQCLQARGISLLAYLDDVVVWHRDKDTLLAQMQQVMCFLQKMGFRLNLAKSHPYPAESTVWLWIQWLPQSGHWHLPLDEQSRIRQMALDFLASPRVTCRQLERMVGLLNFACQIHRFLRPYVQPLTRSNTLVQATEQDRPILLPPYMQDAFRFWASPVPWHHVLRFHVSLPQLSLWTDASPRGWGALLEPARVALGRWSSLETSLHVNLLELRALVFFNLRDLSLLVFTDNETVRYALASCRACSPSLRQAAGLPVGGGLPESLVPGAPGPHGPECGSRRPQSRGASQYRVDPPTSGFRRHFALGWSSGGGPDGFCQPPPAPLGVFLSSPGRSGGGLLKYRLERLRVLLSVSSSDHASTTSAPDPQVAQGRRDSVAPARSVVSPVATEGGRPSPPAGDSLSADGRGDRVALIRSLHTLDRTAFLRQVLGARYPARVFSTLFAAFCPSSQRQHDLAWRTFQAWLPVAAYPIRSSLNFFNTFLTTGS